jgi:hypothetical protein
VEHEYHVHDATRANASDVEQAKTVLRSVPLECHYSSFARALSDGRVQIHIRCPDKMDGMVEIKDGVVTQVR